MQEVLRCFQERKAGHGDFCTMCENNHKSFKAVLEEASDAAQWTSKLAPPYAQQIVETMVSSLVADVVRYRVRPRPKIASAQERATLATGALAHELLLSYQLDCARFGEIQPGWVLQDAICGLSPLKVYWKVDRSERITAQVDRDEYGYEERVDVVEDYARHDDPAVEVVRVEDFMWEEAATSLQGSPWVCQRILTTFEELKRLEAVGVYKNVDKLKDEKELSQTDEFYKLDEELYNERRAKGRIELLEFWKREDGQVRCMVVANRKVLVRDERNIYDHGDYPFVALTTMPEPFRIPGRSLVSKIRPLQEYLWSLMNQRLDNIKFLNNFITIVREDVLDTDQFKDYYPGAVWTVPGDVGDTSIRQFTVDPTVGQVSLAAETMIKQDFQSVTGGMPWAGGEGLNAPATSTATGVSTITALAQRHLSHRMQNLNWALERIGDQLLALNQQFVTDDRVVAVVGADGVQAWKDIFANDLPGRYHVNVEPARESLMRQEKRAEAQARIQVAAQTAAIMAATGHPWNMRAFGEDFLRSNEIDDIERYFSEQPAAQGAAGVPGTPGAASPNGNGNGYGVTNPALAAGPTSPSNETSMSPVAAIQQLQAMAGGPNNA